MTDLAIIFSTLVAPILAIWASEWRQHRRQKQDNKEWVFRTLMTTRSSRLDTNHINALNHIVFAFANNKDVLDSWSFYFNHLNTVQGSTKDSQDRWLETANDRFLTLMEDMAKELKIPFSKTNIEQPSYYPMHYELNHQEQLELRKLQLELLRNERSININATISSPPNS